MNDIDKYITNMNPPKPIEISINKEYFREKFKAVICKTDWKNDNDLLDALMKCFDKE